MKMNRMLSYSLFLLTIFTLSACGDDPVSSTDNGSMTAKVDGDNWGATTLSGSNSAILAIVGAELDLSTGSNRQISLSVPNPSVGTRELGGINSATGTNVTFVTGSSAATLKTYSSTSGSVVIDELSATGAKGSFSARVEHNQSGQQDGTKYELTEGKFDITF